MLRSFFMVSIPDVRPQYLWVCSKRQRLPILITKRWAWSWSHCTGSQPTGGYKSVSCHYFLPGLWPVRWNVLVAAWQVCNAVVYVSGSWGDNVVAVRCQGGPVECGNDHVPVSHRSSAFPRKLAGSTEADLWAWRSTTSEASLVFVSVIHTWAYNVHLGRHEGIRVRGAARWTRLLFHWPHPVESIM